MTQYVVAVDQGTASTRCMVFDPTGTVVCSDQVEHRQLLPRAGWVEHDPQEIWALVTYPWVVWAPAEQQHAVPV